MSARPYILETPSSVALIDSNGNVVAELPLIKKRATAIAPKMAQTNLMPLLVVAACLAAGVIALVILKGKV